MRPSRTGVTAVWPTTPRTNEPMRASQGGVPLATGTGTVPGSATGRPGVEGPALGVAEEVDALRCRKPGPFARHEGGGGGGPGRDEPPVRAQHVEPVRGPAHEVGLGRIDREVAGHPRDDATVR